jgi:hypothetical protein
MIFITAIKTAAHSQNDLMTISLRLFFFDWKTCGPFGHIYYDCIFAK